MQLDIAIIGGGAAGLAAAVFAARENPKLRIAVLEKAPRVGRKLLATGNGTCNLSNAAADLAHYHGAQPAFVLPALEVFSPDAARAFFASIGVECVVREDRRIYPLCGQAGAVLDCLRLEGAARGVRELCGDGLVSLLPEAGGFALVTEQTAHFARQVILCTGGAAAPGLGGSAAAYEPAEALGHTRTSLLPSIVQLTTDPARVRALKGVRVTALATLMRDGRPLAGCEGEILFTDYGLSGPAAMQISRPAAVWKGEEQGGGMTVKLDFLPDLQPDGVATLLNRRSTLPGRSMADLLTGLIQKRLGQTILKSIGFDRLAAPVSTLEERDILRIAWALKGWQLPVTGTRDFADAQVTAGGLETRQFNAATMESKLVAGLYAAGEVLDIDGDCGGYNLQWAWSSAFVAARSAVTALRDDLI